MNIKRTSFLLFILLSVNNFAKPKKTKIHLDDIIISGLAGGVLIGSIVYLEELQYQKELRRKQDLVQVISGNNSSENKNYIEQDKEEDSNNNNQSNNNSENKVYFKDVIGLDKALVEVKEVVDFMKNPQKYKALGAKMPRGILLEGPPGTGKTLIAKAIANEAGCNFFYESASSFVEMYVGVGSKRVREIFQQASKHKPAIIFIDEIDAIGAVSRGAGANEEYRQTLNELLTQMDGYKENDNIIVIAATNNANALDKALKRPGRFTRIIKIPNPDKKARKEILSHYISKLPKAEKDDKFIEELSEKTGGFSAAELANIINEAAMIAVREGSNNVTKNHIEQAFEKENDKKN